MTCQLHAERTVFHRPFPSSTTRKLEPSGLTFLCSTLSFLLFLLPPFYAITSPRPVKSSDPRTHLPALQIENNAGQYIEVERTFLLDFVWSASLYESTVISWQYTQKSNIPHPPQLFVRFGMLLRTSSRDSRKWFDEKKKIIQNPSVETSLISLSRSFSLKSGEDDVSVLSQLEKRQ